MNDADFERMRKLHEDFAGTGEPADFVKEKKLIMRSNESLVKRAREKKKEDYKTYRELKKIIGKTKTSEEKKSIYSCWDKYVKGR